MVGGKKWKVEKSGKISTQKISEHKYMIASCRRVSEISKIFPDSDPPTYLRDTILKCR